MVSRALQPDGYELSHVIPSSVKIVLALRGRAVGNDKVFKRYDDHFGDEPWADDGLAAYAAALTFGIEDIEGMAAESITDSSNDKGCDFLYVDPEDGLAIIAQCYRSKRVNVSQAPASKAAALNQAVAWIMDDDAEGLPEVLHRQALEFRSLVDKGDISRVYIWYVHNVKSSQNSRRELEKAAATLRARLKDRNPDRSFPNIVVDEIGKDQFKELVERSEAKILVREPYEIHVGEAFEVAGSGWKSVVAPVSGRWLADQYEAHGTDLFSANLRGYLGSRKADANINNGIKATAASEPENFFIFNNGITLLVENLELKGRRGSRKVTFDGLSIVNGAQTTGSIGSVTESISDDLLVMVRFIEASKVGTVDGVVRFNNSQNKVESSDFRSNDYIQDRLRKEFEQIPGTIYSGGRRGGAEDVIKRNGELSATAVAQSLAAFHGWPMLAYSGKSLLWADEASYRKVFEETVSARHIVFCYSLYRCLTEIKNELSGKSRNNPDEMTKKEIESLKLLSFRGSQFMLMWSIANCMEDVLEKPVSDKFLLRFVDNISVEDARTLWRPLVDKLLNFSGALSSALDGEVRVSQTVIDKVSSEAPGYMRAVIGAGAIDIGDKIEIVK